MNVFAIIIMATVFYIVSAFITASVYIKKYNEKIKKILIRPSEKPGNQKINCPSDAEDLKLCDPSDINSCNNCEQGLYTCRTATSKDPIKIKSLESNTLESITSGSYCLPPEVEDVQCDPEAGYKVLTKVGENLSWRCQCSYPLLLENKGVFGDCTQQRVCGGAENPLVCPDEDTQLKFKGSKYCSPGKPWTADDKYPPNQTVCECNTPGTISVPGTHPDDWDTAKQVFPPTCQHNNCYPGISEQSMSSGEELVTCDCNDANPKVESISCSVDSDCPHTYGCKPVAGSTTSPAPKKCKKYKVPDPAQTKLDCNKDSDCADGYRCRKNTAKGNNFCEMIPYHDEKWQFQSLINCPDDLPDYKGSGSIGPCMNGKPLCIPDPCNPGGYWDPYAPGGGNCVCGPEYISEPDENPFTGKKCVRGCSSERNPCGDRGACFVNKGNCDACGPPIGELCDLKKDTNHCHDLAVDWKGQNLARINRANANNPRVECTGCMHPYIQDDEQHPQVKPSGDILGDCGSYGAQFGPLGNADPGDGAGVTFQCGYKLKDKSDKCDCDWQCDGGYKCQPGGIFGFGGDHKCGGSTSFLNINPTEPGFNPLIPALALTGVGLLVL